MKTINTAELKRMRDDGEDFLLVNTLDEQHADSTRIPDSINIPESAEDFSDQVENAAGSKHRQIVVYCASSECHSSTRAAEKLQREGFKVSDYKGGAKAWRNAGEPIGAHV